MRISALDLKRQLSGIRREIDAAIKEVIDNTGFILGEGVKRLEENSAKYCGCKHAIGVSNGTDAISLSLIALGIKEGEGVIVPSFTYYASAGAVANIGAVPVFADIDPDTYNISVESIGRILGQKNKIKVKAIMPVHLYGQCADMDSILKIARKNKIKVLEDTAQAFGANYKGKKAGTLGDCGAVSFYPGKNLGAFGDAGLILTNSSSLAEKLKILRNQGNKDKYYHSMLGRNNRMDTIQAVVVDIKLKYLDDWNRKRQEIAQYYNSNLAGLGLNLPFLAQYSTHIYHQYTLRSLKPNKDVINGLQEKGIDSRIFYPVPLHLQQCFKYLGYKRGDFRQSEKASRQVFTLPIYPELTQDEKEYIVQSVKEIVNG